MIREKRRGKLSKGILLQQDNARVHTCKIAMDAVERNGYGLIPHPAYSPDLAPSDYFLFPNLKKDIHGRHFRSNEEVLAAVEEWVRDKDPGFFSSGLMALEHRWSKCIILEAITSKKKRSISPRNKLGWFFIDSPSYYYFISESLEDSMHFKLKSTLEIVSLIVFFFIVVTTSTTITILYNKGGNLRILLSYVFLLTIM